MITFTWFLLGVMVGVCLAAASLAVRVILFDPETNEKIEQAKQARYEMHQARLSLEKAKTRNAFIEAFAKHKDAMEDMIK